MSFGARLKEARKRKGLTQEGLGKGLGTDGKDASKAVVHGWEKGDHFPRVDQLEMICDRLDVSADFLLYGKVKQSDLPAEIAELASSIGMLPPNLRDDVLGGVRSILDLARQAASGARPATVESQPSGRQVKIG